MIVEMQGTCDGKPIIFNKVGRDRWETIVPADLEDGTYVVDIYAKSASGIIAYYAAVLYLSKGQFVSLRMMDDKYNTTIREDKHFVVWNDGIKVKSDERIPCKVIVNGDRFYIRRTEVYPVRD